MYVLDESKELPIGASIYCKLFILVFENLIVFSSRAGSLVNGYVFPECLVENGSW